MPSGLLAKDERFFSCLFPAFGAMGIEGRVRDTQCHVSQSKVRDSNLEPLCDHYDHICPRRHGDTSVCDRKADRRILRPVRGVHHHPARAHLGQQFHQLLQEPVVARRGGHTSEGATSGQPQRRRSRQQRLCPHRKLDKRSPLRAERCPIVCQKKTQYFIYSLRFTYF